jgi:hypothetical protein
MKIEDPIKVIVLAIIIVVAVLYFYNQYIIIPEVPHNETGGGGTCSINEPCFVNLSNDINIAAFNMQIFGLSKASNDSILDRYADIFNDYTITFASEVRDESGEAVKKLCANPLLENYTCFTSSRAGLSTSKENYFLVYRNANNIKLVNTIDYNIGYSNIMPIASQRPPLMALFNINGKDYRFYTMHTSPSSVPLDLALLENITAPYKAENASNTIILGDLNLACSYAKGQADGYFKGWIWNIKDTDDTTVANSSCAYDRIITNFQPKDVGIYKNITKDISDHYLVWIKI